MDHDIEEIFVEGEKESPFKKIFVIVIAVFLIVMFVSYVGISYGIGDIIGGLVESDLISENIIELDDGNHIIFEDEPLLGLNEMYENNRGVEFKVCLGGEIVGGDYYIDEIIYPKIYSQKYNQVVAEPCSVDSLIDLHSHPEKHCIASQQDMKHFDQLKLENIKALMVIMCEEDRINIYS